MTDREKLDILVQALEKIEGSRSKFLTGPDPDSFNDMYSLYATFFMAASSVYEEASGKAFKESADIASEALSKVK